MEESDFGYLVVLDDASRMFITFEGIDYSGKTTQATLLVDMLKAQGRPVLFLREPGGTPISEKIREILLDREHGAMTRTAELFLFSAARTQLVHEVIRPALREGTIVVCDRFFDSTTAYQGHGRDLALADVETINRLAVGGTIPDLTVLVDVEPAEIMKRLKSSGASADRMESGGMEFFERVRRGYRSLAAADQKRFIVINGMRPVDVVRDDIWNRIQSTINS